MLMCGSAFVRTSIRSSFVATAALLVIAVPLLLVSCRRRTVPPPVIRWPTVVSTLAGVGAPGLAEGRGSQAAFADPFGVAVDATGTTYVADAGDNNVIWRIDQAGSSSIVAGGAEGFADGRGRAAAFNTPSGLAVDEGGNLVVADTANHAVRRVTPAGDVVTLAGNGEPGRADGRGPDARFNGPVGVAIAPGRSVIVADTYNDCIRRITPDGQVTTIAGTGPGYRDGPVEQALFDTPSGVAVDAGGAIFVADTGNDAIRRIDAGGRVTTIGMPGTAGDPSQRVALIRPIGVAVRAGFVYVTDATGRVIGLSTSGDRVMDVTTPFRNPTGIASAPDGTLRVADSDNYLVRRLTRPGDAVPSADIDLNPVPWLTGATLRIAAFPWPVDPQHDVHDVAATLGEARGSLGGDGRERLHSGIDVRAPVGTIVRAVHEEKVERVIGATGFDSANEAMRVGVVSYVHVRVGRRRNRTLLDPSRFAIVADEGGRPVRVRVRRGTRFRVGDAIGTVNRFAHVHLDVGPRAGEINPLSLPLEGFTDRVPPTINGVDFYTEGGERVVRPRKGPVPLSGRVAIIVEAYDRVDGSDVRRKLGVYALGYQVLLGDGSPAAGFEQPRMTIEFDRLPSDGNAGQVIYAEGSGITVYGSKTTRFRYIVTNGLHEGRLSQAYWDTSQLPPGEYRVRVIARDHSGNAATQDVPVTVTAATAQPHTERP